MWATVRPLTKNTKLGKKVATTVVVKPDSARFQEDANEMFKNEFDVVIELVLGDIITARKLPWEAKCVAFDWFRYVTSYIIQNATFSPMFDNKQGEYSIISGADLSWSIKTLSNTIYLQALGYCFYKIVNVRKNKNDGANLAKILTPCLLDLGEHSLMEFSRKCSELFEYENSFGYYTMSNEGIFELLNWIGMILSSTMNKADSGYLEGAGKVSAEDMVWAFNQVRIDHFSNCCMALKFGSQVSNQVTGKKSNREVKKKLARSSNSFKKRKSGKKSENASDLKTNPHLPWDLLQSHVFPKLPFDSLMRLKCVCKEWKETISSTYFQFLLKEQEDHLIQSYAIVDNFFEGIKGLKVKKFDGLELLTLDIASTMDMYRSFFYASCSGLLCLICASNHSMFVIGNPLTDGWTSISPPPLAYKEFDIFVKGPGLAVNLSSKPSWYKLVVLGIRKPEYVYGVEEEFTYIFSSETGEWKESKAVLPKYELERYGDSVYANGLLYWASFTGLHWFDLDSDVVGSIDFPGDDHNFKFPAIGIWEQPGKEHRLTCSIFVEQERVETYSLIDDHQWVKFISVFVGEWHNVRPFPYLGGLCQLVWEKKKIVAYNLSNGERWIVAKAPDIESVDVFAFKMNICSLPQKQKRKKRGHIGVKIMD